MRADIAYTVSVRQITLLGYMLAIPPLRVFGVPLSDAILATLFVWLGSTFVLTGLLRRQHTENAIERLHFSYALVEMLFMLFVVHELGTVAWVGVFFPVYTVYYACTLLSRWHAAIVTGAVMAGFTGLTIGEALGIIPHHPLFVPSADSYRQAPYILGTLVLAAIGGYTLLGITFERFGRLQRAAAAMEREERAHGEALMLVTETLGVEMDAAAVLRVIARALQTGLDADRSAVWLVDEADGVVRRVATAGHEPGKSIGPDELPVSHPFVARVLQDATSVVAQASESGPLAEIAHLFSASSLLVVPFQRDGQVKGALSAVMNEGRRHWAPHEIATVSTLAMQGALALERAEMAERAAEAEALRRLDHMKNDFFQTIGHELRRPLTVIDGYVQLLIARPDRYTPDEVASILAEVHQSAREMNAQIEDLSALARAEMGTLQIDLALVDVAPLLGALAASYQALPDGSRVVADIPSPLPQVWADPVRLRQVVGNLMTNALRYAPESEILLQACCAGASHLVIRVQDHGPGIPPEAQAHVWERSYRTEEARERVPSGSGIGLAVVKMLVEAQRGRVGLQSSPGGSTFEVFLPLPETSPPLS